MGRERERGRESIDKLEADVINIFFSHLIFFTLNRNLGPTCKLDSKNYI